MRVCGVHSHHFFAWGILLHTYVNEGNKLFAVVETECGITLFEMPLHSIHWENENLPFWLEERIRAEK